MRVNASSRSFVTSVSIKSVSINIRGGSRRPTCHKPNSSLNNITSEDRESSIRNQALNRSIHTLLKRQRRITIMIPILPSRIIRHTGLIISRIRPAANILRAIIAGTSLITQINMDIRDVDDLNWRFSTRRWTGSIWFVCHRDGVCCDIGPLAEAKDCQTEEGGGPGSDSHDAEVMG